MTGDHPDIDWSDLLGQWVQLHQNGRCVRVGYVEDVTYAADALWLQGHGSEPRALYLKADGCTARIVSKPAGNDEHDRRI